MQEIETAAAKIATVYFHSNENNWRRRNAKTSCTEKQLQDFLCTLNIVYRVFWFIKSLIDSLISFRFDRLLRGVNNEIVISK